MANISIVIVKSSSFTVNLSSAVYESGAHNQQKVKYKQLLNLTVSWGWKVVSTRHPQPWQKKGSRNNGFQGEMIGGCPINLQQESHWGPAMHFILILCYLSIAHYWNVCRCRGLVGVFSTATLDFNHLNMITVWWYFFASRYLSSLILAYCSLMNLLHPPNYMK